jgi:small subunit ribosomal protein S2
MVQIPSLAEMLKAGLHFGHQKSRWHPKMEQYIFGLRGGVHVLDLERTAEELAKAADYVKNLVASGKTILFVGTKRQAREIIKKAAQDCGMPFLVERWIGGLLTNFDEARHRIKKYKTLKQQIQSGEIEKYTKKEQIEFKKSLEKMDKYLSGLHNLDKMPDALFIADMRESKTAITEAGKTNVPVVGVCDTNVNPENAVYAIPANDDAVSSIKLVAEVISAAIQEGAIEFEKNKAKVEAEIKNAPVAAMSNVAGKSSLVKSAIAKTQKRTVRTVTKESSI